ncbi:MAG: T9SS type A sorting domain-containing protein, partial [Bacteroidota bacterium]
LNGNLSAGTNGDGVFMSDDGGANWTQVNNGLGSLYIRRLYSDGTYLYSCSDFAGIFISGDGGQNWEEFNNGLVNTNLYDVVSDGVNLIAATAGASTWIRPISDFTGLNSLNNSSASIQLFPNPTSGRFTIKGLPEDDCIITLSDLMGRELRRIVTQGERHYSFNAEDLQKGNYLVHVLSDRLRATTILVLN